MVSGDESSVVRANVRFRIGDGPQQVRRRLNCTFGNCLPLVQPRCLAGFRHISMPSCCYFALCRPLARRLMPDPHCVRKVPRTCYAATAIKPSPMFRPHVAGRTLRATTEDLRAFPEEVRISLSGVRRARRGEYGIEGEPAGVVIAGEGATGVLELCHDWRRDLADQRVRSIPRGSSLRTTPGIDWSSPRREVLEE